MAQEKILVVDADEKSQKLLEVSFKKEGYQVLLTESMKDAIKTIGTENPDLIICDSALPDGDGFTLCQQLKLNPKFATIPFIFLTEDVELSRKMKAFELGAAEYLQKPIFIKDVTSRVKLQLQELNKSKLHDAQDDEQITGSLEDITVIDLLQTIESKDRSGILELEREAGINAEVSFEKGNILDAQCGPLRGEEALYRLMLWPKGTFKLEYKEIHSADHIEKDSAALLIEGMRRFERWNDMVQTLPHLSRKFRAVSEAKDQPLPLEVQHIVDLFEQAQTLRHAVDHSPVDDLTTLRIIRKLLDETLLEDVTTSEDSLRQSAQHTNLAAWLSERTVHTPAAATSRPRRQTMRARRGDARLFDTTPGFKSVPGLNADSLVESDEDIQTLARTIEEISSPQQDRDSLDENTQSEFGLDNDPSPELEEGLPPEEVEHAENAEGDDVTHWRFHWDKEAGQAVATPRERPEDPFALEDLEQDLQRIEQMRREEEARRIAAERAFAEENQPPVKTVESQDTTTQTEEDAQEPQEPREITKELHRESVLAEVERRKKAEEAKNDPRQGIEDLIEKAESGRKKDTTESFAEKVAKDYEQEPYTSRQRTDQFIPVLDVPDQDDIETAEIPRQDDVQDIADASDAPSQNLVPLGAPEDTQEEEPTVSEEEAEAFKAKTTSPKDASISEDEDTAEQEREAQEPPADTNDSAADTSDSQDKPDVEEPHDEDEDVELEEIQVEDPAGLSQTSQAEDIIAHRTPRNQEIVHAEVELKKGSEHTDDDADSEDEEEDAIAAAIADTSDDDAPETKDDVADADEAETQKEPDASSAQDSDEDEKDDEPKEPEDTKETTEDEQKEEDAEEEGYLLDAPLFADEEEGFNKAGLFAAVLVIAAVIVVVFMFMGDDKPKEPVKNPTVATTVDATTDTTVAQKEPDATPDLSDAIAQASEIVDAAQDMPATDMASAALSAELAPDAGQDTASHAHQQTASMVLALKGQDPAAVEDPIKALDTLPPEETAPEETTTTTTPVETTKPDTSTKVEDKAPTKEKTIEERTKEIASLIRRERYKNALKPARQLVKDDPKSGQAAALLGSAELNGANDAGSAIKNFERAQSLGYRSSSMYLDMATAYFMTNNRAKAKSVYQKFLKAYPKHKMAKEVESILNNQF